jgi:RHS repeat-associated protein
MLPAPAGVTALAGQVLKLDGTPLPNVLLEIDSHHAITDNTGRFLIQDLGPGHRMMLIDGGPAGDKTATYGTYRVGVDLKAGKTNLLSYVIWMTALDTQHFVHISSPTTADLVITNPNIPGLELHLPAGTVIHDARGKVVTQVGITPIPVKQPPFPLKRGATFPVYFTIQPGGATFSNVLGPRVAGMNAKPKGAQIYYENHFHALPNTQYEFWNYDPFQRGRYVYGHGHVSGDAKMIAPDQGTQIWSFDGAMLGLPNNGCAPNGKPGGPSGGEPVDLGTGLFIYTKTDLALNDVIPLSLTRTYRQSDFISRAFGIGNNLNYDMFIIGDDSATPEGYTYQDLYLSDGSKIHFTRTSPCTGANGYCDYTNAVYEALSTPGPFYGAVSRFDIVNVYEIVWFITLKDGTLLTFPEASNGSTWEGGAIIGIQDRYGNTLTFNRDSAGNLLQITSPNGRWIQFTYDGSQRITAAQDSAGRTTSYTYNSAGYLATATDANGGVTSYNYDANGNMTSITDPRNITYIQNLYDVNDMVYQQTLADGGVYQFSYTLDSNSNVTQTNVTDPRGYQREVTFNSDGYMTSDIQAMGAPEAQAYTYNRQEGTGLILGITDALNRATTFTYDATADVIGVTQLAGTASAATTSLAYNPQYDELSSITDPLGNVTSTSYDGYGNMLDVTDPLGYSETFAYNQAGQPITMTDPLGNQTQLTYTDGIVTSATDALGRTVSTFVDSATRYSAVTDPLGNTTRINYNPLNEITSVIDPLGNTTSFTYDGNGNQLTVTDANQNTTSYTYDNMNRPYIRTDPLGNSATAQYDLNGNLIQMADRKGQVTTSTYDGINRPTFVGYGAQPGPTYQSTVSYTFDSGNRLTGVTDSITGAISRTYDGLNHVLSETTPLGSVAYTYDSDERRQTMTVSGQSPVNYTFDNDSRLTSITQGSAAVDFGYDDDGRRTSLALPNGNTAAYSYDAASQLLGIVYQGGALGVANLNYSYDLDGRRIAVSGTLANENLPAAVSSATYNADNQLTQWGSTVMTYDLNGNTINDGTNTYVWDARNRLVSANSNSASFTYDALERRMSKTLLSTTTSFVYDGPNPVQELQDSTVTASLLTGGLDEHFQRTDATGAYSYLTDAMGSTEALTNSTGAAQTTYSYGPYGSLSITGTNSNDYTYTGREADGIGTYYFRARYYNPNTGRFLTEDPLGVAGSPNLYEYANDNPLLLRDPLGLSPTCSYAGQTQLSPWMPTFGPVTTTPTSNWQYSGFIDNGGPDQDSGMLFQLVMCMWQRQMAQTVNQWALFLTYSNCSSGGPCGQHNTWRTYALTTQTRQYTTYYTDTEYTALRPMLGSPETIIDILCLQGGPPNL